MDNILYNEEELKLDSIGTYEIHLRLTKFQTYKLLVEVKTKQCVDYFNKLKSDKIASTNFDAVQSLDDQVSADLKEQLARDKELKMKESEEKIQKRKEKMKRLEERKLKKASKKVEEEEKEEEEENQKEEEEEELKI
jgi:hypothetical protein